MGLITLAKCGNSLLGSIWRHRGVRQIRLNRGQPVGLITGRWVRFALPPDPARAFSSGVQDGSAT